MARDLVQRYKAPDLAVEVDSGARTILPGTNVTFSTDPVTGVITINAASGSGSVTSVGATGSTGLTIGGTNPVTTSGTITFTLSANLQGWSGIAPSTKADLASPTFTGDPKAPTPATADNDTSIATTAYVKAQGYSLDSGVVHLAGVETITGRKDYNTVFRATGMAGVPASGAGVEYSYDTGTGTGYILAYDRTGAAYRPMNIQGSNVVIAINGTPSATFTSFGIGSSAFVSDAYGNVRNIQQNLQNANYQLAITDWAGHVIKNNNTGYAWTIPPNATTAFIIGTAITLINDGGAGNIVVTRGAGVVLLRGNVDANITLLPGEMITILKIGTDRWKTP